MPLSSMKITINRCFVFGLLMTISGCATTTADLVGGSAGALACGNSRGPRILDTEKASRVAIHFAGGGGDQYGGTLTGVTYDMHIVDNGDLGFSAGFFKDDSSAQGTGSMLSTRYHWGLGASGEKNWFSIQPEYQFLLVNYPETEFRIWHDNEFMNLYCAMVNMIGFPVVIGFRKSLFSMDFHIGPYFGNYTMYGSQDSQLSFSGSKTGARMGMDIEDYEFSIAGMFFTGRVDESSFIELFINMAVGYRF